MSTHNICFHREIRKISILLVGKASYLELCNKRIINMILIKIRNTALDK